MGKKSEFWDSDRIVRVHELWNQTPQLSILAMAQILGTSKNGLTGKLNRLGLRRGTMPESLRRDADAPPKAAPVPRIRAEPRPRKGDPRPLPFIPSAPRTGGKCQWPTGVSPHIKFLCEEPTKSGIPWCQTHFKVCYKPRPNLTRNEYGEEIETRGG